MEHVGSEPPFWADGLRFKCVSCGHCCRHEPGYVFLSPRDLRVLAEHFSISDQSFVDKYCRNVDLGIARRLSLRETSANDCIFWNNGCTVYPARPLQCRTYPFWPGILASEEDWISEGRECPGIGMGPVHSEGQIASALKQREREVLISPP